MSQLNRFHLELLELIHAHDGNWSWYQLDRTFDVSRLPNGTRFIDLLRELEDNLLVEAVEENQGMPSKYRITENARILLAKDRSL